MFKCGELYLANLNAKKQIVVNQGGTSSGKTYSIIQVLFSIAISEARRVITVVGQDVPNLKVGAIRDALEILSGSKELQSLLAKPYNKSDRVLEFKSGSIIEFKSYDDAQDAKSGKRDYSFFNEANGIPYMVYAEVQMRTRIRTFIDYNPNAEFWVHDKLIGTENVELIISDHRHNPFLSNEQHKKIEDLKEIDFELWRVYARGLTGKIEGLIFRNWSVCQGIPSDAKMLGCGMDFGFTNDPTTIIQLFKSDGQLWVQELLYSKGLTNTDINKNAISLGLQKSLIVADSAEPKSIYELRAMGLDIKGATKGADSIKNSIDLLKRYHINVTADSINLRKELLNYRWKVNRLNGIVTNEPIDSFNHCIDALRYIATEKLTESYQGKPKFHN